MALKPGKNLDELCYPFIYETAYLCDYEVITDELCGHIGAVLADLPDEMADLRADLEQLQPLAFHLNGSVRGRLAIDETHIALQAVFAQAGDKDLSARDGGERKEVAGSGGIGFDGILRY